MQKINKVLMCIIWIDNKYISTNYINCDTIVINRIYANALQVCLV